MNNLLKSLLLLLLVVSSLTSSVFAGESDATSKDDSFPLPDLPDWSVLFKKREPSKTIIEGNKRVDVFKVERDNFKPISYALAKGVLLDDNCKIFIWIRGKNEDKRIIYDSKIGSFFKDSLCTVSIPRSNFEEDFKYCVLAGIHVNNTKERFTASFSGGPAGDREYYWFEWGDPLYVTPDFYCILK